MGDQSSALLLLLLLLLLAMVSSQGQSVNITQDILQALRLSRVPDMSKANVSQEEWTRMTQVYLDRVAARRSAEAAVGATSEDGLQKLYTFQSASGARTGAAGARARGRRSAGRALSSNPRTRIRMELPLDAEVDQAELRVLVTEPGPLRLFELSGSGRQRVAVAERRVAGWTQLDVTDAARRAVRDSRPLLLELRCRHCQQPALNVLAVPEEHARTRRSTSVGRRECGKDGHRCCRHAMEVEFAQLPGLEFILQPKSFDAGFCRGRCPPRFHPAHHHALIQGLIRRRDNRGGGRDGQGQDGARRVPRPCCAPANLMPLDILFLDEDNPTKLKLQAWSDMRVVDCACA